VGSKEPRRAKPNPLKFADKEIASVYEKIWEDPNEPIGKDLCAYRGVKFLGGSYIFDNLSNEQQAELSLAIAVWFFRYSRWIRKRPEGKAM
jgi:hypothetical protein